MADIINEQVNLITGITPLGDATATELTIDDININGTTVLSSGNLNLSSGLGNLVLSGGTGAISGLAGTDYIIETTLGDIILTPVAGKTVRIDNNATLNSSGYINQQGIFGEIYVADASTAQSIPTGAAYTKSTAFTTDGNSSNVTNDATNDKITFTQIGIYDVVGSFSGQSGTANVLFRGTAFLNGVEQSQIHFKRKFATSTDSGSMGFSGTVDVTTVPWDLDFRLRHDNGGSINFTIEYANIRVNYLGKT